MANKKKSSRLTALIWMLVVAVVIGVLIGYEQISILYVLATLAIVALLLIVGFADLEAVGRNDGDSTSSEA